MLCAPGAMLLGKDLPIHEWIRLGRCRTSTLEFLMFFFFSFGGLVVKGVFFCLRVVFTVNCLFLVVCLLETILF